MRNAKKLIWILLILLVIIISLIVFLVLKLDSSIQTQHLNSDHLSLAFVGDIMLSRHVGEKIEKTSPTFPFEKIGGELKEFDIMFGNLECQISDKQGEDWKNCCKFKANPEVIEGLKYAGFDIVSLANNHALDFGPLPLQDTLIYLVNNGIRYVGIKKNKLNNNENIVIIEKKETKIAYLAYYDKKGRKYIHNEEWYPHPRILIEDFFVEDIKRAKQISDVVVVSIHWGEEYSFSHNQRQEEIAHLAVNSGADIIIGHHPHVLQDIEEYNGGVIAYSLGNFVFDQPTSKTPIKQGVRNSMILIVNIKNNQIRNYEIKKVKINDNYQPQLING